MSEHAWGLVTADYRVKCTRCGFEQYSAAPQPVIGCFTDEEFRTRASFVFFEVEFLIGRLKRHSAAMEEFWKAARL